MRRRSHISSAFEMPQRGWRRLIDDLLQLSRVNRGELAREHVDVSALAARVVADRRRQDASAIGGGHDSSRR